MHWFGIVMILLFVALLLGAAFWIGHWYWQRKHRAAYNNPFADPATSSPGKFGWIGDKVRQFKVRNSRSAAGAYEPPSDAPNTAYRGRGMGGSALDPDDAWSAHVGREADGYGPYDEEHELGTVNPNHTSRYGGGLTGGEPERGRSRTRSPVRVSVISSDGMAINPFGDDAEPSNMREERKKSKRNPSVETRRSVFRENM